MIIDPAYRVRERAAFTFFGADEGKLPPRGHRVAVIGSRYACEEGPPLPGGCDGRPMQPPGTGGQKAITTPWPAARASE
jgi:hypothetical protein